MHILNTIFYLFIAINVLAVQFFSDAWVILTIVICILGASLSLVCFINDLLIKPKQRQREENKKIEEEKNTLMDDLEKEAIRRKQKDRLQQN